MRRKNYDIAVIGNGMVGVLSSFLIKNKFPQKKIILFGTKDFKYSASLAAGCMHAVFCEIESNFYNSKLEKINLDIGLKSRKIWRQFFKKYKLNNVITSKDTYFYIKKNSSEFEKKNFFTACKVAKKNGLLKTVNAKEHRKLFKGQIKNEFFKCVKIKNEFGFNPNELIKEILKMSKKINLDVLCGEVKNIKYKNKNFVIDENITAKKVVVACGYNSYKIAKNIFKPVPILKGVGSAFLLQNSYFKNINTIIRTSNRGGAQCGLHIVPYDRKKGKIYVGAGNYVSNDKEPWARTETFKYLINLLENELIPKKIIYQSKIKTLLGYRPRSLDNYPSIGPVNKNLFYVSGTNRVGLSWASYISDQIIKWLNKEDLDNVLNHFKPKRKLKSWGKLEEAAHYYASSRLSNLIEHKIISNRTKEKKIKYEELINFAKRKNLTITRRYKFKKDFVIDPDCYNYFE